MRNIPVISAPTNVQPVVNVNEVLPIVAASEIIGNAMPEILESNKLKQEIVTEPTIDPNILEQPEIMSTPQF